MRGKHLGPGGGGDEPVAGDGNVAHHLRRLGLFFLPAREIHGAGKWRHHHKLRKGDAGFEGHRDRGVERGWLVRGKAEDERSEHMDAVLLEGLELPRQGFARVVEVLEDRLKPFGSDRFHADERPFDVGFAHGIEVLDVFARLHGDLREKDHIPGELGELRHQQKAFCADSGEFLDLSHVVLFTGEAQIGQGNGIEVIVCQGDEAETDLPELDDLVDDGLEGALTGLLSIGAPHAAERAVFGAPAYGLHRGPHVFVSWHQVPARGEEFAAADPAAVINLLPQSARQAVGNDLSPGDVAISFDDRMRLTAIEGFLGEERGVDATVDDPGSAFARDVANFIAAQGIAGMDADTDNVAGLDGVGDDLFERFVDQDWVAGGGWGRGGQNEEPPGGDDGSTEGVVAGIYEMNADESTLFPANAVDSESGTLECA